MTHPEAQQYEEATPELERAALGTPFIHQRSQKMSKPTYTKLAADGSELPADHPNDGDNKHLAVRVDHPLLKEPLIISAYRACDRATFKDAQAKAEAHEAYGWKWRMPTVEELFLVADRTNPAARLDPNFFPDADGYEPTWSSTVDASSPSVCAWNVSLSDGSSGWFSQSYHGHVRAVRAGQ